MDECKPLPTALYLPALTRSCRHATLASTGTAASSRFSTAMSMYVVPSCSSAHAVVATRSAGAALCAKAPERQGLTLVHFSAQRKRFLARYGD